MYSPNIIASSVAVQGSGGGESEVTGGCSSGLPQEKEKNSFEKTSEIRFRDLLFDMYSILVVQNL